MRGASNVTISGPAALNPREKALEDYRRRMKEHKELSAKLKQSTSELEKKILIILFNL
jgi:hypothetical protein